MQAFKIHKQVVEDYKNYLKSFTQIRNERIKSIVESSFDKGTFMPDALIQFNPSYKIGSTLEDLEKEGVVHTDLKKIFWKYGLYKHQVDAIRKGVNGESFIVTSGTGSGKSLTYIATIFNKILKEGKQKGVKAIIVYPMNALINSQEEEIKKQEINYLMSFLPGVQLDEKSTLDEKIATLKELTPQRFPITYGKYTGQEGTSERDEVRSNGANIILTNYMMLELIMTRNGEGWLRDSMQKSLEYLVFDELHTYRGRQGADVSMLIRRIRNLCSKTPICIGTSATMASGGSALDRKEAVANVGSQIFGTTFKVANIIEETLDTCTIYPGKTPRGFDLQEVFSTGVNLNLGSKEFVKHNLAIWLENRVALRRIEGGILERGEPRTLKQISELLATDSGEELADCEKLILEFLNWTEGLNIEGSKQEPRRSYLPFKIHQFISQTGNVYVTLDSKDKRVVSLEMGKYLRIDGDDKPLFPVLFSRYSGYDFMCVKLEGGKIASRDNDELPERITRDDLKSDKEANVRRRVLTQADFPYGYIVLPEEGDAVWSEENEDELPESWLNKKKTGGKFDNYYEYRLPKKIYFNTTGAYSFEDDSYPIMGWYIPAKLLIDPTAGVVYDNKTNENTKLMRLGNEGRSTATTITSYSILKALSENGIEVKNQKLLSFTDNRQDASLQAGHFNDFLMLGRLRSAIYYALKDAPNNSLEISNISNAVFEKLNLKEWEYATYPSVNPLWTDTENEEAVKDYILLRILYDLKRGWRYNTPNLEQCGLLDIGYKRLEEFCTVDELFKGIALFDGLKPDERCEYLLQILNFFRTSYAFEYYKLLDKRGDLEEKLRNKLNSDLLWSLDVEEKIEIPNILLPNSVGEVKSRQYTSSAGVNSYLGKYLKRLWSKHNIEVPKSAEFAEYIVRVCHLLAQGNFLKAETVTGEKGEAIGYRLRIDKVIWKLGNGKDILPDQVRLSSMREVNSEPNSYFKKFYQQDFGRFAKPLIGKEHTGQLGNGDRISRENDFRKGNISTLYCSPTMELGIDISELNVVHMRNVPPSPANYAQRSGRAGRSGQAALVFAYCSNGSPHDRNYFRDSKKMVAGSVVPPKIDLSNEELILSHFNAYMLMELGLTDVRTSVGEIVDLLQVAELPIKDDIKLKIEDHIVRYAHTWAYNFKRLLLAIDEMKDSTWLTDEWLLNHSKSFARRFDDSLERWRYLYRAASRMIETSRSIIDDPTIQTGNYRKSEAEREERLGKKIKSLLINDEKKSFGGESEFYVFRYLASEGFLPGYNFTRLPVRTFLGYRYKDKGEFVSRPRFVALKEFGPGNSVYHKGEKFRISKMEITQADSQLQSIKISKETGYAFLGQDSKIANNDPITHKELKGDDSVSQYANLLELKESEARPQERISCEEEERMSAGYHIDQYFSFAKGLEGTRTVVIREGEQPLLQVIYDQSARLIQVNKGWRVAKDDEKEGFNIGNVSGKWKRAKDIEKEIAEDKAVNVRIFTTDTADVLYVQPVKALQIDENGVVSLAFALKRAIERQFQIEESEIGVWIMGEQESRNILIYEAAEGSLGILSSLVADGQAMKRLFVEAYQVLHFNPTTKSDTRMEEPKASYENLLSYYNQRYHDKLDRFSVKEALERLMECDIDNQQGMSLKDKYEELISSYDLNSATEKPLIEYLYRNGYALPDKAQFLVPDCYVSADFVYKTDAGVTLIFCDGTVHDRADVMHEDKRKRQCCIDEGYDIIEWHHTETIELLVARRKDIFRKVR